jgi:hypothetical protein
MKILICTLILLFKSTVAMNNNEIDHEILMRRMQRDAQIRIGILDPALRNKLHSVSSHLLELELLEKSMDNIREKYIGTNPQAIINRTEYISFKKSRPLETHPVDKEIAYCNSRVKELDERANILEKELDSKN